MVDNSLHLTKSRESYANPKVLVDTNWVADHIHDDDNIVRIAEVDCTIFRLYSGPYPKRSSI